MLASLAPKSNTSLSLLSSATLGQNPSAPTSAHDRQEGREDLVVRRGIDRLRRKHGDGGESGSEGSDEEAKGRSGQKGKGKAREEIVDIISSLNGGHTNEDTREISTVVPRKNMKSRNRQVSLTD